MATKKITLNELRTLVKQIIKEETDNKIGINLRSLLDGELAIAIDSVDFSNYKERNKFIDKLENRLMENDWISMSNGTTFEKTFTPTKKF
jgi:hypothetical protein